MKHPYYLVVIGGGPAGTPVAIEFAKLNSDKEVLLIDARGELGGECLFDGCIPSKIMEITAKHIQSLKSMQAFGIALKSQDYTLVWETIVQRKKEILAKRTAAAKTNLPPNVTLVKGTAAFTAPDTLLMHTETERKTIHFERCVIATGSSAYIPSYPGNGADKIWSNEEFFEHMELMESLCIIGGGAIAIEFAQILATLGVKITLMLRGDRILKQVDSEFADTILTRLQADENITILTEAHIQAIDYDTDFTVSYEQNGVSQSLHCERVLSATGRRANIEGLQLEKAGVDYDQHGIAITASLQTSHKHIYANGDVAKGFPKFAHTAQYAAHTIAQNLFLNHQFFKVDYDKNSWVLFSQPNIVMAGISETEAQKRGLDIEIGTYKYQIDAKSQIEAEAEGVLKFVVDKKSHRILGISIMTHEANGIAGEAALIVAQKLKLTDLVSTIHPHPTLSESYTFLAKQMMGALMVEKLKSPVLQGVLKIERFL